MTAGGNTARRAKIAEAKELLRQVDVVLGELQRLVEAEAAKS